VTARQEPRKHKRAARPIRKKRDFDAASQVARELGAQPARDDAAERRLQALLHEMDKFDDAGDDLPEDLDESLGEPGHTRRWSDGNGDDA
jgi:hypothetical protein